MSQVQVAGRNGELSGCQCIVIYQFEDKLFVLPKTPLLAEAPAEKHVDKQLHINDNLLPYTQPVGSYPTLFRVSTLSYTTDPNHA